MKNVYFQWKNFSIIIIIILFLLQSNCAHGQGAVGEKKESAVPPPKSPGQEGQDTVHTESQQIQAELLEEDFEVKGGKFTVFISKTVGEYIEIKIRTSNELISGDKEKKEVSGGTGTKKDSVKVSKKDSGVLASKKTGLLKLPISDKESLFVDLFLAQMPSQTYDSVDTSTLIKEMAKKYFYKILATLAATEGAPLSGTIFFNKNVPVFGQSGYVGSMLVRNVELEISAGSIRKIKVEGSVEFDPKSNVAERKHAFTEIKIHPSIYRTIETKPDTIIRLKHIVFTNLNFPIPFSTVKEYYTNLRSGRSNSNSINTKEAGTLTGYTYSGSTKLYLSLPNLMLYSPSLALNTENFSPADTVLKIPVAIEAKRNDYVAAQLRREKAADILKLSVFSDPVGFNDDQPNGIIQLEASKRFTLLPIRRRGLNALNFIEPFLTISKIENEKKDTVIFVNSVNQNAPVYKLSRLSTLKYSSLQIGAKINVLTYPISAIKSTFYFNMGGQLYRTGVRLDSTILKLGSDSLMKTSEITFKRSVITSAAIFTELVWAIQTDPRYGFDLGFKISRIGVWHPEYEFSDSPKNFQISTSSFRFFWNLPDKQQLFFRTNFFVQRNSVKNNFLQIQIGYSKNIALVKTK